MGRRPKSESQNLNSSKPQSLGIRPLAGYLLIQPESGETQTASGIVLPETAQEKPAQGKILAIGDDMLLPNGQIFRSPVSVGDRVVFKKWGGDEIKVRGVEYKLVKFEDLIAILEG